MDKQSCAITGHSPQRFKFKYNEEAPVCLKLKAAIEGQISQLYHAGVVRFYVDCSVGVATWAAEVVLKLRSKPEFADIELFCGIPFPEHADMFKPRQRERYDYIMSQCADKHVINRHYSSVAYKRLNYFLVDNTQYLIAVYDRDKNERSGLVQMINYASKMKRNIVYINPDTAEITAANL